MGLSPLSLSQFLSSILFLFHFHTTISSSNYSSSSHFCAPDQSLSLLHFKESFSINSSASGRCQHPKTESWKEGTDCCSWDGITCDLKTGQVTALDLACSMLYGTLHSNSTLFSLHHLQKLDLSDNNFQSSHISSQFGQFSNLTYLNLNYSVFAGRVPSEISHLSKLVSLDLSGNGYVSVEPISFDKLSFDKLVRNLTQLRELDLSSVDMSLVTPNSLMNLSSSLSSLILRSCGLQGKFPSSIRKFKHLQQLDLADNNLTGPIPYDLEQLTELVSLALSGNENDYLSLESISFDKLVQNVTQLRELYLCWVNMSLVAPNSLMNLSSSLSSLILYSCGLQGKFPSSMRKFKHLQQLDLRKNNLTGSIPDDFDQLTELVSIDLSFNDYLSVEPSPFDKIIQNLTKLSGLRLGYVNMPLVTPNSLANLSSSLSPLALWGCGLKGKFPGNIFLLPNLQVLDLTFTGDLTGSFIFLLPNLQVLDLTFNGDLTGSFPSSNVSNALRLLGLSHTRISVYLENDFFTNLKLLEVLSLRSSNIIRSNLTLIGHLNQLTRLDLAGNNFGGQIPSSLENLVQLRILYLDSNNFLGQIPDFLGNLTLLENLGLSNNQLSGPISSQINTLSLRFFDLSKNNLHGPIPSSIFKQENLEALVLASNNKLTGEISSSICKLKFLRLLDLSNNSLSGFIPQCLGNFSNSLSILNLGMNNLQGTIFSPFSKGNNLGYLNLNGNELEGKIPSSIIHCTLLEALDLGNNKIEDTFPYFLETLPELYVLVLKSNKLQGFVSSSTTNNSFSKLRILDISNNSLSGPLPIGYFSNLEAKMTYDPNIYYMMAVTWEGFETEFTKIQSTRRILDLSNNKFTGEIPELIGKLTAVQQLNFSHNSLTGHIQSSIGMLTYLESLDLSSNLFTGRIPVQLADLTFLAVLNLSHNQLEGAIPSGKHFNTFNASSFEGNLGLCGFPMPKECNSDEAPPLQPSNFHDGDDSKSFGEGFGWKAVAIGYGCGFVFGVTMGYVVFRTRKPAWFLKVVEDQWNLKARRTKKNARRNGARRN
ncbi:PREDICTED: receptor-like protein 12 [Populus euphratica]|uniref:Receptor-like protein 12 n=1 Tax=Populus euphratica TaxID=75702 RepID=A0AAJ6T725_POPEU|nr:PREDICTED: receptor-like protein 12 [Populus euphratica]